MCEQEDCECCKVTREIIRILSEGDIHTMIHELEECRHAGEFVLAMSKLQGDIRGVYLAEGAMKTLDAVIPVLKTRFSNVFTSHAE